MMNRRPPPPGRPRRLVTVNYGELGTAFSVTIGVKDRVQVFRHEELAGATVEVLRERASTTGAVVYAYCVMPDHIHLVLGPSLSCDVMTFVGQFKNLTLRAAWRLGIDGCFWQRGFWERKVRSNEDPQSIVNYVLANPVRAGLVSAWQEYRFSGSLVELDFTCRGQAPAPPRGEQTEA